jgi:hypothetical protein
VSRDAGTAPPFVADPACERVGVGLCAPCAGRKLAF